MITIKTKYLYRHTILPFIFEVNVRYKALCLKGILFFLAICAFNACNKMLSVPPPTSQITAEQVFASDKSVNSAMAGIYTNLISGNGQAAITSLFAGGATSYLCALSADELVMSIPNSAFATLFYNYNTNHIIAEGNETGSSVTGTVSYSDYIWSSAYIVVSGTNAIINGIAASTSATLHDSIRHLITAEAKGVRAFAYLNLVYLFNNIPLYLGSEPVLEIQEGQASQQAVFAQIIQDLKEAHDSLPENYFTAQGNRIRFSKWAAAALLARAYLYNKQYNDAIVSANEVINNTIYSLESNLNNVFLVKSNEAIWQLQQNINNTSSKNAVPEATLFLPNPLNTGVQTISLSPQLMSAFEPGDLRRKMWVDSTSFVYSVSNPDPTIAYFPFKYKTGLYNAVIGGAATEYYMVLRLAEQYLIRAEAEANLGDTNAAISDLNLIRRRAGLPDLSTSLKQADVIAAVAHERQIELFCEWGHRWLDLKRTGQAHDVLSTIPLKQPWAGDYQLLYPIPYTDLMYDSKLVQNPGY